MSGVHTTGIIVGCTLAAINCFPAAASEGGAKPLRVITFGTSLTQTGGWQPALQHDLAECIHRQVVVFNVARSGATSNWGVQAVAQVVALRPDVVLIEFAINDASLNRWVTLASSRANLNAIIAQLRSGPSTPEIYLMAMNPVLGMKRLSRPLHERYVEVHRDVALATRSGFIDHRPTWQLLSREEMRAAIPDGVHPTSAASIKNYVPTIVRVLSRGVCN